MTVNQLPIWYLHWAQQVLDMRNAPDADIAFERRSTLRGYMCALYMADLIKGDEYSILMRTATNALDYTMAEMITTTHKKEG